MSDLKFMKFVGTAQGYDATGAIAGNEGRPDVQLGGMGEFNDREISVLASMGIVLEQVDDGGLSDKNASELKKLAEKEGVELEGDENKGEVLSKLRAAFAESGEQRAAAAIGGTSVGASGGLTGVAVGGGPAPGTGTTTGSGGGSAT